MAIQGSIPREGLSSGLWHQCGPLGVVKSEIVITNHSSYIKVYLLLLSATWLPW